MQQRRGDKEQRAMRWAEIQRGRQMQSQPRRCPRSSWCNIHPSRDFQTQTIGKLGLKCEKILPHPEDISIVVQKVQSHIISRHFATCLCLVCPAAMPRRVYLERLLIPSSARQKQSRVCLACTDCQQGEIDVRSSASF